MNSSFRKAVIKPAILVFVLVFVAGCATQSPSQRTPTPSATPSSTPSAPPATPSDWPTIATPLTYSNTQFNFTFSLPDSWNGYSIVNDKWQGWDSNTGKVVETGPLLSIRHPLWTSANKLQDIPIMIFTLDQWTALGKEAFNVGAAPIPPSELGRNANYVFALPARYNYAFTTNYKEVELILAGKPLHTN